jgi:hypothetical protein
MGHRTQRVGHGELTLIEGSRYASQECLAKILRLPQGANRMFDVGEDVYPSGPIQGSKSRSDGI